MLLNILLRYINFLNYRLNLYFETQPLSSMTILMDQMVLSFYEKINYKAQKRLLLLGTLSLFIIGYLKYRREF